MDSGEWAGVRLPGALAERWEVNSVFSVRSDLPHGRSVTPALAGISFMVEKGSMTVVATNHELPEDSSVCVFIFVSAERLPN